MRALKTLVYVMGVMLVVGFIALVVTIAYRLKHASTQAPTITAMHTVMPPNSVPHSVALPVGAKIIAAQSDGDRVMVRLGLADGSEELLLLDWKSGATLATLTLK